MTRFLSADGAAMPLPVIAAPYDLATLSCHAPGCTNAGAVSVMLPRDRSDAIGFCSHECARRCGWPNLKPKPKGHG